MVILGENPDHGYASNVKAPSENCDLSSPIRLGSVWAIVLDAGVTAPTKTD